MKGCETHEKKIARERQETTEPGFRCADRWRTENSLTYWCDERRCWYFLSVWWLSFCIHDINNFKSRSLIFHGNFCELPSFRMRIIFCISFYHFNRKLDLRLQVSLHSAPFSLITLWIRSCQVLWIVWNEFGIQITKSLKQSSMMVFYLKQTFHGVW